MKKNWWKLLAVILIAYSIVAGFLLDVPELPILRETIRNLYFHVTMWFAMIALFLYAMISSIRYLNNFDLKYDARADEAAKVGMLMGTLGLLTGMLWAQFTWGAFWVNDPKLNGSAISMLLYLAYFILRGSLEDPEKRARISAVYNIFAFVMLIVFIGILPRMTDSLHPGNGGNPAFSGYDLNSNMKMVFYPAVIAWILFAAWIFDIRIRMRKLNDQLNEIADAPQDN